MNAIGFGERVARWAQSCLGVAMIAFGTMKLVGSPRADSLLGAHWQLYGVAIIECGLGAWLLSGRWMRVALLGCVVFAIVGIVVAAESRRECGCFGTLTEMTRETRMVILSAIGATACWLSTPRGRKQESNMVVGDT
jgi:uncharacterized membrane protein YphA (DoxX/SURF4 family)